MSSIPKAAFARALTIEAGNSPAERLAPYLPPGLLAAAIDAATVPILIVDAPPPHAVEAVEPLRAAGAFAYADAERLIAIGPRSAIERAAAGADDGARAVLAELLRAFDATSTRSLRYHARAHTLDFSAGAKVMGILNVTPDSFFDRGKYSGVDRARERAAQMVADGAATIDIGGQSYAHWNPRIAAQEERERVVPVVEALVRDGLGIPLSIDTFKAEVADAALAAGADIINDCSGLSDPALVDVVARYGAALVIMHLKGELNVRAAEYPYDDALCEIVTFLRERVERALAAGVANESIAVDPGLEFGKEPAVDCEILDRFGDLRSLGLPILLAASRKSFIGRIFHKPARELLVPSLATAALGVIAGANLVRVHDVAETVALCRMIGTVRPAVRGALDLLPAMPT
jgi:dihydropteroate synthase